MTGEHFEIKGRSIGDMFSPSSCYITPLNLDRFDWTRRQVSDLVHALIDQFDPNDTVTSGDQRSPCHLGSISTCNGDNQEFVVIDGKHRLAVLLIVLAMAREASLAELRDQANTVVRLRMDSVLIRSKSGSNGQGYALGAVFEPQYLGGEVLTMIALNDQQGLTALCGRLHSKRSVDRLGSAFVANAGRLINALSEVNIAFHARFQAKLGLAEKFWDYVMSSVWAAHIHEANSGPATRMRYGIYASSPP